MQTDQVIDTTIQNLLERSLPEGGFALFKGDDFRADATAWAVLALAAGDVGREVTRSACRRLATIQLADGRLAAVAGHPEAYWPTSLAVLSWKAVSGFEDEIDRAVRFLLGNSGKHAPRKKSDAVAHDTSIRGWPWIENTHSWIEPTALAILALKVCGYGKHERVQEAVKMILDRQLKSGGWNYGNTRVFGNELYPIPESTGLALSALAGFTRPILIKSSLDYLIRESERIRTPLTLSWTLFGLAAWSQQPSEVRRWITESILLQKRYGRYDTTLLSQLLVAYFTSGHLLSLFCSGSCHA